MTIEDEPRSLKELRHWHPKPYEEGKYIRATMMETEDGKFIHEDDIAALLQRTRARLIEEGMKTTNEATERGVKRHREWAYFWKIELIDDLLSDVRGLMGETQTKERKK